MYTKESWSWGSRRIFEGGWRTRTDSSRPCGLNSSRCYGSRGISSSEQNTNRGWWFRALTKNREKGDSVFRTREVRKLGCFITPHQENLGSELFTSMSKKTKILIWDWRGIQLLHCGKDGVERPTRQCPRNGWKKTWPGGTGNQDRLWVTDMYAMTTSSSSLFLEHKCMLFPGLSPEIHKLGELPQPHLLQVPAQMSSSPIDLPWYHFVGAISRT